MMILGLLWPTFALVALVFVVWGTLFVQRMAHMRRTRPKTADFASGEAARRYFQPVELPANNLANLFELPVLYFALVPLLIVTGQAHLPQVVLAWLFVALRAAHSYAHVVARKAPLRFMLFLGSSAVLIAMWVGFLVDAVRMAGALAQP
ncbi:MAPEG family protein [Sphingomonas sp.]|uniref:MAPEG family protein n=1 Tax=Sphingomonas sp. TaxID=28214 RepID=UPI0035C7CFA6